MFTTVFDPELPDELAPPDELLLHALTMPSRPAAPTASSARLLQ
jgi:hypothetical protein